MKKIGGIKHINLTEIKKQKARKKLMNEINIDDEIKEATVRFGKSLSKSIESILDALDSLLDVIDELEPYQRYELLHERKKPRGSIRRKRRTRK